MQFRRVFTVGGLYHGVKFVERESSVREKGGRVTKAVTVVVPEQWSQNATDILAQKYMRRAGLPTELVKADEPNVPAFLQPHRRREGDEPFDVVRDADRELDARDVFRRIAGCWAYWGWKLGYFKSEFDALVFFEEAQHALAVQAFAPATPQWLNTGLNWAYGLTGPDVGLWAMNSFDGKTVSVSQTVDSFGRPQLSACYIHSVEDTLLGDYGIASLVERESRTFKFGGGAGSNFSRLRGEGEPLSGGGRSSGLMSWLRIFDVNAGSIKSGGTSRRAAKMDILDVDHPDIVKFIRWKAEEEAKVAFLVAGSAACRDLYQKLATATGDREKAAAAWAAVDAGVPEGYVAQMLAAVENEIASPPASMTTDYEAEAYNTVSGQNANNTIRVSGEFMKAVRDGGRWKLVNRVDGGTAAEVDARDLWGEIVNAAWKCADPGLHFADNVADWNTVQTTDEIRGTNPCSEYIAPDDTSCNLASLRLTAFDGGSPDTFRCDDFVHAARLLTVALDISCSLASYPSKRVAEGTAAFRNLGLGYADLGALLMRWGIPYGSEAGCDTAGWLTAVMHFEALATSVQLAERLGSFPKYKPNRKRMNGVVNNFLKAARCDDRIGDAEAVAVANPPRAMAAGIPQSPRRIINEQAEYIAANATKYGFRNANVTLLAPTGTIGILMDCDTTGVEPDYALVKWKTLAGGGYMKIVNGSVPKALETLGYDRATVDKVGKWIAGNPFDSEFEKAADERIHAGADVGGLTWPEIVRAVTNAVDLRHVVPNLFTGPDAGEKFAFWNRIVCGNGTVEGCGLVKSEHLPVFDCANRCGTGQRAIAPMDHVRMMSAAQAFLSMGISKTVNMPSGATPDEVGDVYYHSWVHGVKCNALYRDGSKLSQPLAGAAAGVAALVGQRPPAATTAAHAAERQKLPDYREGYTQKFRIGGHKFYLRTGEYPDGRLGEIWLDCHKEGATLRGMMNAVAMAVSIGLQHGVPLSEFLDAFAFTRFEPSGPVQGHENLKFGTSVLDVVFRDLGIRYGGRSDWAHVQTDQKPAAESKKSEPAAATDMEKATAKGYEGTPCGACGTFTLLRSGTCLYCQTCGATTGCS